MGRPDWDRDSEVIKDKLAKAYGRRPVEHDAEVATETITTKSSGFVLNIAAERKAELQAQLDKALESQVTQAAADWADDEAV